MTYNKQYYQVQEMWSRIANYDIDILKGYLHAPYNTNKDFSPIISPIISLTTKNLKSLYFGCGIGRNLPFLRSISNEVYGYDIPEMVKRCKKENNKFDEIYDNWDVCINQKYDFVLDVFSLQIMPDVNAINDILLNIAQSSRYFYIITRNYLEDDKHTNLLQLIMNKRIFKLLNYTTEINRVLEINYPKDIYGEFLFESTIIKEPHSSITTSKTLST
jgi:hypothetical protein